MSAWACGVASARAATGGKVALSGPVDETPRLFQRLRGCVNVNGVGKDEPARRAAALSGGACIFPSPSAGLNKAVQGLLCCLAGGVRPARPRQVARGDAGFGDPNVCKYLEAEVYLYAIRLPAKDVHQRQIEPLLTRPAGRILWFLAENDSRSGRGLTAGTLSGR